MWTNFIFKNINKIFIQTPKRDVVVCRSQPAHNEHAEDKINQLVYELYDLTPEEVAIIEHTVSPSKRGCPQDGGGK
ncbi:MAG: hypothetical protein ACK5QC_03475 [Bacteroidota bacterium]|jgi:hypothetical protein